MPLASDTSQQKAFLLVLGTALYHHVAGELSCATLGTHAKKREEAFTLYWRTGGYRAPLLKKMIGSCHSAELAIVNDSSADQEKRVILRHRLLSTGAKNKAKVEEVPEVSEEEVDESEEEYEEEDGDSVENDEEEEDVSDEASESSEDSFEDQGSSDDDNDEEEEVIDEESDDDMNENEKPILDAEHGTRSWTVGKERAKEIIANRQSGALNAQFLLNTDDLSSDDEEGDRNTVGRIPLHWYDAYDHIGYDITGTKIMKRKGGDRIDAAIAQADDPASRRTVYDMYNDREVVLSERDLEIIRRMQAGAFAHPEHNDTPDYVDYFSGIKEIMPISAAPEPKRRFVPSKWELMNVMKIVKAIKEGRYVSLKEREAAKQKQTSNYQIWQEDADEVLAESRRYRYHLPAPKIPLPGHAESYNPPEEYLLTEEEKAAMEEQDPSERQYNFIPKKHSCLRHVAGYENFVKERYERCLDLYLCPRKLKRRLNIDPETLVPRLPRPRELRPYPNTLCLQFLGHSKAVRSIAVSPDGQYMASGSEDGTVRLWEVDTGLCRYVWKCSEKEAVARIEWNPTSALLAIATGNRVILLSTGTSDKDSCEVLESFLAAANSKCGEKSETVSEEDEESDAEPTKKSADSVKWKRCDISDATVHGYQIGPRIEMTFNAPITYIAWHYRGDYLAVLSPTEGKKAISVHQVSKATSQFPFSKSAGNVQCICFHPSRPFLFVATQQHVKIYHLIEQKMMKRLISGVKWISAMDVHPSGDHIIISSYDKRIIWFDLDLSSSPYKTLKYHEKAVRHVQYHKRYPLFASASDDGTVHVFHGTVYSDLMRNPMIVPLKILRGHGVTGGLGVLSIAFHPRQPWIFSAGSDGVINLYQDI